MQNCILYQKKYFCTIHRKSVIRWSNTMERNSGGVVFETGDGSRYLFSPTMKLWLRSVFCKCTVWQLRRRNICGVANPTAHKRGNIVYGNTRIVTDIGFNGHKTMFSDRDLRGKSKNLFWLQWSSKRIETSHPKPRKHENTSTTIWIIFTTETYSWWSIMLNEARFDNRSGSPRFVLKEDGRFVFEMKKSLCESSIAINKCTTD